MMNKSEISWCHFTWNPLTGCNRGCDYCYARRQAARFGGDVRLNLSDTAQLQKDATGVFTLQKPFKNRSGKTIPYPAGFAPTVHEYRFADPAKKKKPANIFVCSMADLFAPDIPTSLIVRVIDACRAAPWHNYLFLTKYPERYYELAHMALLPTGDGFWYGTTVTTASEMCERLEKLNRIRLEASDYKTFVSVEPIFERMSCELDVRHLPNWFIVGAETGKRRTKVVPEKAWFDDFVELCEKVGIPLHVKPSAEVKRLGINPHDFAQMPKELYLPEPVVAHCSKCKFHTMAHRHFNTARGEIKNHFCQLSQQPIAGRDARTSPSWCVYRRQGCE